MHQNASGEVHLSETAYTVGTDANASARQTPLVVLLESNQNHAVAKETEICTTLPASMGCGGVCADDCTNRI